MVFGRGTDASVSRQAKSGTEKKGKKKKNVVRCPGEVFQADDDGDDRKDKNFSPGSNQSGRANGSWVRSPGNAVEPNLGSKVEVLSTPRW